MSAFTANEEQTIRALAGPPVANVLESFTGLDPMLFRQSLLDHMLDPRRDVNRECGYPEVIDALLYYSLYERNGIAKRVVSVLPEESWALDPEVYEDEDEDTETPFEASANALVKRLNLWHYLHRVDELSGVGRFGVLLLGLDDGPKKYKDAVDGIDPTGKKIGNAKRNLLFVRPFDETVAKVIRRETDQNNPRYGKPTAYQLTFKDVSMDEPLITTPQQGETLQEVHWTRVIHVADNRHRSEIYGVPRMKPVFNYLVDLRKVGGGSAEMFWKGGFPGTSIELQPGVGVDSANVDTASLKKEINRWSNGLSRTLLLAGATAKTLAPAISDPKGHADLQLELISVSLGIPKRVLFGSERGELSSTQDAKAWAKRLARRQDKYLSPLLIQEFFGRMIALGVVAEPLEKLDERTWDYRVRWPDLAASTDAERAAVALQRTQGMAAFVAGGVDQLMPPREYLSVVQGFDAKTVEQVMEAVEDYTGMEDPLLPDDTGTVEDPAEQQVALEPPPQDGAPQKPKTPASEKA